MKAKILNPKTVFFISEEEYNDKKSSRDKFISERDSIMPITEDNATYISELNMLIDRINNELVEMYDYTPDIAPKISKFQGVEISYSLINEFVVQQYSIIENDPYKVNNDICLLKSELSNSDYKITKCYEATLIGEPLPYDIQSLHTERQNIRDRINELEGLLQI